MLINCHCVFPIMCAWGCSHVYAIAEAAFTHSQNTAQEQCIVIRYRTLELKPWPECTDYEACRLNILPVVVTFL